MDIKINERLRLGEAVTVHKRNKSINLKNHPGIYVPPPLIYAAFFSLSLLFQKLLPLKRGWFDTTFAHIMGGLLLTLYFILAFMSIRQFLISKNTIVTIKPARSLQTTGIYAFTRNPMYLSLFLLYSGIAIFSGNWWTFLMLPFIIMVVEVYVIRKEERYLHDAFGAEYDAYKRKVRRWI
jgi:protein-S-isoprenylcysteine O-methyltransferase Ste14